MKYVLSFLLTVSIFAAPAYNKLRTFTNSDGTTFQGRAYGNQHLNWVQTTDGEILKFNDASQDFEYAKKSNGRLKPSGAKYENNNSIRVRSIHHLNKITDEDLRELWKIRNKKGH